MQERYVEYYPRGRGLYHPLGYNAYRYYLKDLQGNNRVVIDQSGTVEQMNHYYPFGGLFGEGLRTSI